MRRLVHTILHSCRHVPTRAVLYNEELGVAFFWAELCTSYGNSARMPSIAKAHYNEISHEESFGFPYHATQRLVKTLMSKNAGVTKSRTLALGILGQFLLVTAGSSVTLSLFSGDSFAHTFCVDYEPTPDFMQSPNFNSPTTPVGTLLQTSGQIQSEATSVISLSWTRVSLISLHQQEGRP